MAGREARRRRGGAPRVPAWVEPAAECGGNAEVQGAAHRRPARRAHHPPGDARGPVLGGADGAGIPVQSLRECSAKSYLWTANSSEIGRRALTCPMASASNMHCHYSRRETSYGELVTNGAAHMHRKAHGVTITKRRYCTSH